MKSILASRIAHRLKFLIRTVQQPICCKAFIRKTGLSLSGLMMKNELALHSERSWNSTWRTYGKSSWRY
ncbi:hypothetical protein ACLB1S_24305 [Escherichia coli]